VYIVHQLSVSQSETQRPADWAQAPDGLGCFAASAGDKDAQPSAPISAPVDAMDMIDLIRMEQSPDDQINVP
jgi:hypothetical protein